jgi:uncharacterized protein (DUF2147 family)
VKRLAIPLALALGVVTATPADALDPPTIVGEWWTEKHEGRIRFVQAKDATYTGVLAWAAENRKDSNNKDPKLRDRSLVGTVLMWNLRLENGKYVDGYVYNPEDGRTYRIEAKLAATDALDIRGYLGISLFGQTQRWTRFR